MSKTKIAISGIGAVGGYYGGLLAARYKDSEDIDIYFISRGENLKDQSITCFVVPKATIWKRI